MEFEKLQEIIAEVLNLEPDDKMCIRDRTCTACVTAV